MKKNLLSAVLLLLVAVFSFGIASFAFFSGYDEGGNNTVSPGSFDFSLSLKNAVGAATVSADIDFKFPTKINFPKQGKLNEDLTENEDFATDGDDTYFNNSVVPIFVTLNNDSSIPMQADFSFLAGFGSGADYSSCVEWFVFNPTDMAEIKVSGKYDDKLHSICDTLSNTDIDAQVTIYSKSLKRLEEGRRLQRDNIKKITVASGSSIEVLVAVWLDFEKFNAIYSNTFSSGKVKVMVTADVSQAV